MKVIKSIAQSLIRNYHILFNKSCCQIILNKDNRDLFNFGDIIQVGISQMDCKYLGKGYFIKK